MAARANPFPWQYFDSPTDSAAEAVVRWIYSEFSGRAYQGFLEQGRGLLVGPFLIGGSRDLIATGEFVERRKMSLEVGMTVVFVAMDSPLFERTLPDAALREQLAVAVERYDPTRECVILLLANNFAELSAGERLPLRAGGKARAPSHGGNSLKLSWGRPSG